MSKPVWIILGVVAAVVLLAVGVYSFVNQTRTEGIVHEQELNAQYLDNQNYLSAYISGFYEKINLANVQSDAFNTILTQAVQGRYDEDGFSTDGAFFSAIAEAYPDLSSLMAAWNDIQTYVTAGREGYRNEQSKLLDMLRAYETWRQSGIVKSMLIRAMGFPSNGLKARIGDQIYFGQAALDKMYQIVLTGAVLDAYNSGTMDPLEVPTFQP